MHGKNQPNEPAGKDKQNRLSSIRPLRTCLSRHWPPLAAIERHWPPLIRRSSICGPCDNARMAARPARAEPKHEVWRAILLRRIGQRIHVNDRGTLVPLRVRASGMPYRKSPMYYYALCPRPDGVHPDGQPSPATRAESREEGPCHCRKSCSSAMRKSPLPMTVVGRIGQARFREPEPARLAARRCAGPVLLSRSMSGSRRGRHTGCHLRGRRGFR